MLQRAAPEFVMWADYFSAHSETRAALEAGLPREIGHTQADEFYSRVGAFLHDVEDLIAPAARLRARRSPTSGSVRELSASRWYGPDRTRIIGDR